VSDLEKTRVYEERLAESPSAGDVLVQVYAALKERGYDPVGQLAGYLLSGDPVWITGHKNARSTVRKVERLDLLEELLRFYLAHLDSTRKADQP
jgi:uncharacterized protein (UPF0297 family)